MIPFRKGINNLNRNERNKALLLATLNGRLEIVKLLLRLEGINTKTSKGYTQLMIACELDYIKIVELLLEHEEIDINAKDYDGETAFMKAKRKDNDNDVKLLLKQKGMEINIKDIKGKTKFSGFGNMDKN